MASGHVSVAGVTAVVLFIEESGRDKAEASEKIRAVAAEWSAGRVFGRARGELAVEVVGLVGVDGRLERRVDLALQQTEPVDFVKESVSADFLAACGAWAEAVGRVALEESA